VTLVAGFLGSGKTTLIQRLLCERAYAPVGVVVNEFGAVGIDGRLFVASAEEVVELSNGCLCCRVRSDLGEALERLLRREKRLARIVIEASGLASPGPIAQTLVLDARLCGRVELSGIVTLAHAANVTGELERHPEAAEQVAYADLLVLNHCDAPGADPPAAEAALRMRNAVAPLVRTVRAECDLASLLAQRTRPERLSELKALVSADHTHGVGTIVLQDSAPRDLDRLKMWLRFLAGRRTHELYRVKGLLACRDHPRAVLVQGTYQVLELGPGPGEPPASSALVLIGRGLDQAEVQRGWEATAAS
jgi:G3E family GTPase